MMDHEVSCNASCAVFPAALLLAKNSPHPLKSVPKQSLRS